MQHCTVKSLHASFKNGEESLQSRIPWWPVVACGDM